MQQDLSPPKYNLSSSDTQTISKVVQGVIFLGVVPMLYPGVGLPMQRRSKIYQALQEYITDEVVNDDKMIFMLKKHQKLLYLSKQLLDLLSLDVFSSIILTKHLGDLLAGLIQVGFSTINEDGEIKVFSRSSKIIFIQGQNISGTFNLYKFQKEVYFSIESLRVRITMIREKQQRKSKLTRRK